MPIYPYVYLGTPLPAQLQRSLYHERRLSQVVAPRELMAPVMHELDASGRVTHSADIWAARGGRLVAGTPYVRCRDGNASRRPTTRCTFICMLVVVQGGKAEICLLIGAEGAGDEDCAPQRDLFAQPQLVPHVQRRQHCPGGKPQYAVEGPLGGDVAVQERDGLLERG